MMCGALSVRQRSWVDWMSWNVAASGTSLLTDRMRQIVVRLGHTWDGAGL
jgi:hypothetical protein